MSRRCGGRNASGDLRGGVYTPLRNALNRLEQLAFRGTGAAKISPDPVD